MIDNIREKLNSEMNTITSFQEFNDVNFLLIQGNYTVEISYELSYSLDEIDYEEVIPFGYIFNGSYYDNRNDYMIAKDQIAQKSTASPYQVARDISNISRKLESLYGLSIFDNMQKIIGDYREEMENRIKGAKSIDTYFGVQTYVELTVNQVKVLGIDYEEHDPEIDAGKTNIEYILSLLPIEMDLTLIPNKSWFSKINKDSQILIKAGTKYLQAVLLTESKESIIDFSPLLLDFIKALELEIKSHYQDYRIQILDIADEIKRVYKTNGKKTQPDDIYKLLRHINYMKKQNYKPNGLSSLYYLFKYFALGESLDEIKSFRSYLPNDKLELLRKEKKLLDRIKELGLDRNVYIHEKFIESENEFLMYYNDLTLALKLMTYLNK